MRNELDLSTEVSGRRESSTAPPATSRPLQQDADLRFVGLLLQNGLVDADSLHDARRCATHDPLPATLVKRGLITEKDREAIEHLASRSVDSSVKASFTQAATLSSRPSTPASDPAAAARPAITEPASVIGDYVLIERIGTGGMGCVYKARQRSLNRLVALKLIRPDETTDSGHVQRFFAEARAAGGLDHPGIVQVYEFGEFDGQPFFSMALVDGESLAVFVRKRGPLPAREAARLVQETASAVHYAHGRGVIHRDIKPHNILLDVSGRPRVADFGIARQGHGEMTLDGQMLGTPSYMPPEQAAGRQADVGPCSDVYSLGATLYFLLVGRPPFQTSSPVETIRQVIECEPAPPRTLNPSVARDLETICLKCLSKEPLRRYPSAADLGDDLRRWLAGEPIYARRTTPLQRALMWARRNRLTSMALAAMFVVACLAAIVLWQQRSANSARIATAKAENDQELARSYVEGALHAPAAGFPFAVQLLPPYSSQAKPLLRRVLHSSDSPPLHRRQAAMALTYLGEPQTQFLVSAIGAANADECGNMISALERDLPTALRQLKALHDRVDQPNGALTERSRAAIVALHLGEATEAEQLCRRQPNPLPQATFVKTLTKWHGDRTKLAGLAPSLSDPALRSALCLALGSVAPDQWQPQDLAAWQDLCETWHRESPDSELHAAAGWALRRWGKTVEAAADPPPGSAWTVAPSGLTFVTIPAGSFVRPMSPEARVQVVTVSRPFLIADRETPRALFQQFLNDQRTAADKKPQNWPPPVAADETDDAPLTLVHWQDVAQFCNWLNEQEGYPPSFFLTGDLWWLQSDAEGYRLPTDAEWELACRAGIDGDLLPGEEAWLDDYAVFRASSWRSRGSRLPNRFGLFDMCGNVSELCVDYWTQHFPDEPSLIDPTGPVVGIDHVLRGGSYRNGTTGMRFSTRSYIHPAVRSEDVGFRLVRSLSEQTAAARKSKD